MRLNVPRSRKKNGRTNARHYQEQHQQQYWHWIGKTPKKEECIGKWCLHVLATMGSTTKDNLWHCEWSPTRKNTKKLSSITRHSLRYKWCQESRTFAMQYMCNRGCLIEDKDRLLWQWQQRWRRRGTRGRVQNLHKSNRDELGSVHHDVLFLIHQS